MWKISGSPKSPLRDACLWRSEGCIQCLPRLFWAMKSHHQLDELKAHLVLGQEPEGPAGFIEGGLNLQLQGGKECKTVRRQ